MLLLVGVVTVAVADEEQKDEFCCSRSDRQTVVKQWRALLDNQDAQFRMNLGRTLLAAIMDAHPEVTALFKAVDVDHPMRGVYSALVMRLFGGIDMAISMLSNQAALEEALDHLSYQHRERPGVKKIYFDTLKKIMAYAVPALLDDYDAMAWERCMGSIISKVSSRLTR